MEDKAREARLRWWGHVQRMGPERLPKRVLNSVIEGKRGRGRPRRRWVDSVGYDLDERGVTWEEASSVAEDRGAWRRVVRGENKLNAGSRQNQL